MGKDLTPELIIRKHCAGYGEDVISIITRDIEPMLLEFGEQCYEKGYVDGNSVNEPDYELYLKTLEDGK